MKYHRVISTVVLFLLLGATLPAFAQRGEEEKGGGQKAQPEQHAAPPQHAQQTSRQQQPQRAQQAQPRRAQQASRPAQPQRAQAQRQQQPRRQPTQTVAYNGGNNGNHYGRISNANYTSHFGHGHSFHMGRPQMIGGYNRFQYGGYSFGYNQTWPIGWGYNDACYVEYIGGAYYMFDVSHPGFRLTLNIF